jgi:GntR family transcriptional regulator/MocR family aminotransferase
MREVYAERLEALTDGAREHMNGLLEIPRVEGGLQTIGWLPHGVDAVAVTKEAARRNIEVVPLNGFWGSDGVRSGLQLGFAAIEPREIRRGLVELAKVIRYIGRQS